MTEVNDRNFGFLIAYVIPGFLVLTVWSSYFPTVQAWLGQADGQSTTVGGFLYGTLASVAAGLIVSAIRWLWLDSVHHWTGIERPEWDFTQSTNQLAAFEGAVQNHYRYYQFYGNTLTALLLAAPFGLLPASGLVVHPFSLILTLILLLVLFVASRDALRKYYIRSNCLLNQKDI